MDTEEIEISFPCQASGEEPKIIDDDETETQNHFTRGLRFSWKAILIGGLMVLLCGVTSILFTQIHKQQSLTAEFQIINNHLKQLLNSTQQNFTLLGSEYMNSTLENCNLVEVENKELNVVLNSTLEKCNLMEVENKELNMVLNSTLEDCNLVEVENKELNVVLNSTLEKCNLVEVENKELNVVLNSTLEKCNLVEVENKELNLLLNESRRIIALASAETKRLRLLLIDERQTSMQLEAENQHQRSILFSDNLSFLWRFCNKSTLQCSRCLPGWAEHASRCFFLSHGARKWEDGRRECLDLGGDLAVVLNADDQAFLTNMTFQFEQQHPQENFHSAWIGLRDMVKEGTFVWVNGNRLKYDVIYWKHLEPNNSLAAWDKSRSGQDCVAIVPPGRIGEEDWLNTWDDIVCGGERHYLCETMVLSLS